MTNVWVYGTRICDRIISLNLCFLYNSTDVCLALRGGHLYMVDSVEENGLVLSGLFRPDPWVIQTWIWFGAKKSHIWQGPDGQVLNASLWDSEAGEPNNQGGHENCTASWGYRLYDTPCEGVMYPLRFICEVPARMESCESPCPDGPVGQREDKCEVDTTNGWREGCGTSGGIYLMGGGSMGLFYIISGFVMAVGYCQVHRDQHRALIQIRSVCRSLWKICG